MCLAGALLVALSALGPEVRADTIVLNESFAGNYDFLGTAASFRDDNADGCSLATSASQQLPGLPTGTATIHRAYLYWAASDDDDVADENVTLTIGTDTLNVNTSNYTIRSFHDDFDFGGDTFNFTQSVADITADVPETTSSQLVTMTGLTIDAGAPHACQTVLGGWGLVIIYEDEANEPLRVINIFDGLEDYRFTFIDLNPGNFQLPSDPNDIDGKLLVLTWEGDSGLGGSDENILFEGTEVPLAGDPLNVSNVNVIDNQFNSTVSAQGINDTYGVDLDQYTLDSILDDNPGGTSAQTRYQADADRVLLGLEVISVTNTPVSDLEITKSHTGDFEAGQNGVYTITVTNNGPEDEPGDIRIQDDLSTATGLTFVSVTGTNWDCTATAAPLVDCTFDDGDGLADGETTDDLTLTVAVDASGAPSTTNTATLRQDLVTGSNFDNISANDSDDDATNILVGDLSTSTKVGTDANAGDLLDTEVINYVITLTETAGIAATGVTVTDDLDADVNNFTEISIPGGASSSFNPTGGANSTGQWVVNNITVPANSSVTLEFSVTVNGATAGEDIDNAAVVTGDGINETINANTLIVEQFSLPSSGVKQLYLETTLTTGNDAPLDIGRDAPVIPDPSDTRDQMGEGGSGTWPLDPVLGQDLTFNTDDLQVILFAREVGPGNSRDFTVELLADGNVIASESATHTLTNVDTNPTQVVFQTFLPASTDLTANAGESFALRITNDTTGSGNRRIRVFPQNETLAASDEYTSRSRVLIDTSTVINIDSADAYDAAYAGGTTGGVHNAGESVFIRVVVTDPFGPDDITQLDYAVIDPTPTTIANGTILGTDPEVVDTDVATGTKIFEVEVVLPDTAIAGNYEITATATEGVSGEVTPDITDGALGSFEVGRPDFLVIKTSPFVVSDALGSPNPKRLPGSVVRYRIEVFNEGTGEPTPGSVTVTDNLPGALRLAVPGSGLITDAVTFNPSDSNLTHDPATEITFTLDAGVAPVDTTPADGCYDNVTGFVLDTSGQMAADTGGGAPSFLLDYDACIR